MDWANERYVRLYTSETADQAAWSWQARMVWPWLLAKADRAGVIATKTAARGVAALTRLPIEHVEIGLGDLMADGCVEEWRGGGYKIRNFLEAQNTPSSNSKRVAELRARERLDSDSNAAERDVTGCNAEKRGETDGNDSTQDETICAPDLSRTEPKQKQFLENLFSGSDPTPAGELAAVACDEINRLRGSTYSPDNESTAKLCRALAKAKHTPEEVLLVVRDKHAEWHANAEMRKRIAPSTLLALSNFEKYLDDLRSRPGSQGSARASPRKPERIFLNFDSDLPPIEAPP